MVCCPQSHRAMLACSHTGCDSDDADSLQGVRFQKGPTSPTCTRTRSSQMPWTQSAWEPAPQSSYLEAHWGPWVSGEQRQLLVAQERNIRAHICFLASIKNKIPISRQWRSCGIINQQTRLTGQSLQRKSLCFISRNRLSKCVIFLNTV